MPLPFGLDLSRGSKNSIRQKFLVEEDAIEMLINYMRNDKCICEKDLSTQLDMVTYSLEIERVSIVERLVTSGFFFVLTRLEITETGMEVFQQKSRLLESMLDNIYGLESLDQEVAMNLHKTIEEHLFHFQDYRIMTDIHVSHLTTFLDQAAQVYTRFPDLLHYSFTACAKNDGPADQRTFLPLEYIKKLFNSEWRHSILYALVTFIKLSNVFQPLKDILVVDIELLHLFPDALVDYLVEHIQNGKTWSQHTPQEPKSLMEYKKCLHWYFTALEASSAGLRFVFHKEFESRFLTKVLDSSTNDVSSDFLLAIFEIFGNFTGLQDISDSFFQNKVIKNIFAQSLSSAFNFEQFVLVLNNVVSKNEMCLQPLLGITALGEDSGYDSIDSRFAEETRIRAMKIALDSDYEIGQDFKYYFLNQANHSQNLKLDSRKELVRRYLLSLTRLFENQLERNNALIALTKTFLLKTDLVSKSEFSLVINFLYESYVSYQQLLKLYSNCINTHIGSEEVLKAEYFYPNSEFLTIFGTTPQEEDMLCNTSKIDYSTLSENMGQFRVLLIHVYVISKVKTIKKGHFTP